MKKRKVKKRRKLLLLLLVSVIASHVMFNAVQLRVYFKMIFHGVKLFDHFAMQNNCPENQLISVGLEGKTSKFYKNFFGRIRYSLVWQKIL